MFSTGRDAFTRDRYGVTASAQSQMSSAAGEIAVRRAPRDDRRSVVQPSALGTRSSTLRLRDAHLRVEQLATQPAKLQAARANRRGGQQRVIEAAQAHADDQQHRQGRAEPRCRACRACARAARATPPAPSTTTTSARDARRAVAAATTARSMAHAGLRGREMRRDGVRERERIAVGERRVDVRRHRERGDVGVD